MLGRGRGGEGTVGERFRLTRIADALVTIGTANGNRTQDFFDVALDLY